MAGLISSATKTIPSGADTTGGGKRSTIIVVGLTFIVDPTDVIISGTTYPMGIGAIPTTTVIGNEGTSIGPGGFGLHHDPRTCSEWKRSGYYHRNPQIGRLFTNTLLYQLFDLGAISGIRNLPDLNMILIFFHFLFYFGHFMSSGRRNYETSGLKGKEFLACWDG